MKKSVVAFLKVMVQCSLLAARENYFSLGSESGELNWEQDLEGEVLVPPQANGRVIVVQMTNGAIHGLDFQSGEKLWLYKTSVPSLTLRGTSTPLIVQDIVYAGFSNGKLVAMDLLTGTSIWESSVFLPEGGTELEQVVDVDGNLLVEGERIFAASYQGKVASFYRQNGRALWKNNASNFLGLEKGLNQIYSVENDGSVIAYDLVTGEQTWVQETLKGRSLSAPATQKNYLVIGDEFGYIYWLNQNDGEIVASKYLGRGAVAGYHHWNIKGQRNEADDLKAYKVFAKPVTYNGVVYIQNRFGAIAAYQLEEQD